MDELAAGAVAAISSGWRQLATTFRAITARAQERFEARDWAAGRADATARLDAYPAVVRDTEQVLRQLLGDQVADRTLWHSIKAGYAEAIEGSRAQSLAGTFFNSVTRRIFDTSGVDPEIEFVFELEDMVDAKTPPEHLRTYAGGEPLSMLEGLMTDCGFVYVDIEIDAALVLDHIRARIAEPIVEVEVIDAVLFREQAAYRVGRLHTAGSEIPFALALRNPQRGIVVDAVLLGEAAVSILFSFTRSHFHIDHDNAFELVPFLQKLMPRKRPSELFTALGFHKHGKTMLYREILDHLALTSLGFEPAPGTPGLVMMVFAMPDLDLVFKVLRDRFKPPKRTTRRAVKATYELVFKHDRAGRLIDAQEFEHLQLFTYRFGQELLEELLEECSATVTVAGDLVTLEHVYIERRVTPLNMVVRGAGASMPSAAVSDYGQAIKDMAAANVFPGDLLIKNFGVTRHGRVVFYDYDEIARITDCVFRALPEPEPGQELDDVPMWGVGPHDIFPEEFGSFLGLPSGLRRQFLEQHGDLLTPGWWRAIQSRVAAGELIEIPPYSDEHRLRPTQ